MIASPGREAWLAYGLLWSAPATVLVMLAVARGWTDQLDRTLFGRLLFATTHPDGSPRRLATAARDIVALGGDALRILFVLGCASGLVADGRGAIAAVLLAVVAVARLSLFLLKRIVRRPRPDIDRQAVVTFTSSFPSGHTFMAVVTYLAAAILIPAGMPAILIETAIGFALVVASMIGLVRVALGVHWPTDVVAGWFAGIAWTSGSLLLVDRLLN
jgi:undecaprenyl-diphosphatase